MKFHADFQIEQTRNWDLLRAYFQSGEVDMAYVMSSLAMDMYLEKSHFRWVGLLHRDGNALTINYQHLNVDKAGLKQIMDLAVEGGILQAPIDIEAFVDTSSDRIEDETFVQQTIE